MEKKQVHLCNVRGYKNQENIGYINAMPINNTLYEIIKKGEIIDVTINDENIETYDLPDTYNL